ncbi:acylphosphatase [Rathayibacter sp. KR2-224]|uniref:acylphosphatase n=1 Tax=Rathayibacter sp. KR2-224 TaxID=3400913 RepID=UPI003C06C85D
MAGTSRVHVIVHGRVHGVGYRYSCAEMARAAGIAGWVRNRPDGTVEAEFEGRPAAVQAAVAWCRHGPSWASVSAVDVSQKEPEGATGFEIH